jgi:murein DD-endopeptidase MepM/ murein hydrolase activator NlpD
MQVEIGSGVTKVTSKLVAEYNNKNISAIFNLFDNNMKNAFPEDQAKDFFANLYSTYGAIQKITKTGSDAPYDLYKIDFENGELLLKIAENDMQQIIGLSFEQYIDETAKRYSLTKLSLPFYGTWYVFWGGETEEQNYHVTNKAQRGAYDFIVLDKDGNSHKLNGDKNEDYYAYGKEVIAPCDGTVTMVVDGIPDNIPGKMNPYYAPGNSIMLHVDNNEYILIGHMIPRSIAVKEKQVIKKGDFIGLCGNSGNSSEAHIHMHMQDREDMGSAIGIYVPFSGIKVNNKQTDSKIVVKGDNVAN